MLALRSMGKHGEEERLRTSKRKEERPSKDQRDGEKEKKDQVSSALPTNRTLSSGKNWGKNASKGAGRGRHTWKRTTWIRVTKMVNSAVCKKRPNETDDFGMGFLFGQKIVTTRGARKHQKHGWEHPRRGMSDK